MRKDLSDMSKGPWSLHEGNQSVKAGCGKLIASCGFLPKVCKWEAEANARLFSVSLEMLDALKMAIEWIEDDRHDDEYIMEDWYHAAKDVVSKVDGK